VITDPAGAAWFVLAGLHSVELSGTPSERAPEAIRAATRLGLRALGHRP
jgi:hypothetical protein